MNYQLIGTPNGARDIFFEGAERQRALESAMVSHFSKEGFREVRTPILEYYDLFARAGLPVAQEAMQKTIDRDGRILVMRPDSTLPVARVVSTQLARETLPLKLFYAQPVFRSDIAHAGRYGQIMQAGVECIGDAKNDLYMIKLALGTLEALGIKNFTFELGHARLLPHLARSMGIRGTEKLKALIDSKNFVAVGSLIEESDNQDAAQKLLRFVRLSGGKEVFDQVPETAGWDFDFALNELKTLFFDMNQDGVTVDFGLVGGLEYYTGVLFRAYAPGAAEAILTGGRYDDLFGCFGKQDVPAIGFAVDLDAVLSIREA